MADIGNVYYYDSVFLRQEKEVPHFHIVVLRLEIGSGGSPKAVVAVVTDYDSDYAQAFIRRFGRKAVAIIEQHEYSKLTKKSVVCGIAYEEDEINLKEKNRKSDASPEIVEKIHNAIQGYKGTPKRIARLL